jgi:hypothetical protein
MIKVNSREDFLKEIAKIQPIQYAVEIGVLHGDFSQMILKALQPDKLILVDPFETDDELIYDDNSLAVYSSESDFQNLLKRFEGGIFSGKITVIKNYSHKAFEDPANKDFWKAITGRIDFIYLDACHLYECVKQDLNDWFPKLSKKGVMAGHDYINHADFGVIQAVDEFCKEQGFEIIILNENGGDWAAVKR